METNLNNRGANNPKRGRPSKEEIAARPDPIEYQAVDVVTAGVLCPCCGRGMVPKTLRRDDAVWSCRCSMCGGRFNVRRMQSGKMIAQPLK